MSYDINYARGVNCLFESPDLIWSEIPIILFGEGNFTFTIALTTLRNNGWNNIVATTNNEEVPPFQTALNTAIANRIYSPVHELPDPENS